jgi:hypothetical protein
LNPSFAGRVVVVVVGVGVVDVGDQGVEKYRPTAMPGPHLFPET